MVEAVQHWFEKAARLRPGSRTSFLQANCDDPAVLQEVLSLLQYDSDENGTVDVSGGVRIREVVHAVLRADDNQAAPARVGPFQLGRMLGSGGMGTVYEAHRVDGEVGQRVAIKFVQLSAAACRDARESALRRFHRERQLLASLRHPYIAGLIDAGTTSEGLPYAVIEQVDGVPVDTYCASSVPGTVDRIGLFLKLCDAVQFAHANMVVHGDIKPQNVLVTPDGLPKLIDFGVATELGEQASLTSTRAFTPGYASPEQCQGLTPTIATDVYGLGAVLYRLLTDKPLREITTGSLGDLIQSVTNHDVVRPSLLKPELRGDLENILLKALHREPHRRYQSVSDLVDDLDRYLDHRPVRATPDSAWYRCHRFVRRNWAVLAVAATLAAAVAVVTSASTAQRQQTIRRAAETRRLSERLLFEVHDEISGLGGTKARERLGSMAVQYLEELQRDHGRDPELVWELINAYSRLAQSRGGGESSVGDVQSASALASKVLELGAGIDTATADSHRLDTLFTIYAGLANIYQEAKRPDQQREAIDAMLKLSSRLHPVRQAEGLTVLGRYLRDVGSEKESADAFGRALEVLRPLSSDPSRPAETDGTLVSVLVGHGRAQAVRGDFAGAVLSFQEAIRRSAHSDRSGRHTISNARQTYWCHISLGDVFGNPHRFSLMRPAEAVAEYRKARSIAEMLVKADPGNQMAKLDVARTFSREAAAIASTQPEQALVVFEKFRAAILETASRGPSVQEGHLIYLTSSVPALLQTGDYDEADARLTQARQIIAEMRKGGASVSEAPLLNAHALLLSARGRNREALHVLQQHLALLPQTTNPMLSANFETIELLERARAWSAASDPALNSAATARLARIWADLKSAYPGSRFVLDQFDRYNQPRDKAPAFLARR
ncbi:MAG TPA: serine/threonine-protein kinase [Bryobacteraceae bacterium]|nr:serine/threonine-protein kinase [Bryobacteraceae bacterium]